MLRELTFNSYGGTARLWALRPGQACSSRWFIKGGPNAHIQLHAREPIELPPAIARAFLDDMRAFHAAGHDAIKKDEVAARQFWLLKQHWNGKLRIADVREIFRQMRDQV
jgi:hypothetical protein